jgi:hypothetical protein
MLNFKNFFENVDYSKQEFSDKNGVYSVGKMIEFARQNKLPQDIEIEELLHNLEPSEHETGSDLPGHPEFIKRAQNASLEFPIIVVKYPDGLWIADGVHRLWKANKEGLKTIRGYVYDDAELDNFIVN